MRLIDLTGHQYGRLTVLRRADHNSTTNHTRWLCRCICGTEKIVGQSELRSGNTKSCGCYDLNRKRSQVVDITGSVSGYLTLLHHDPIMINKKGHRTYWVCHCSNCGRTKSIHRSTILRKLTNSCGCLAHPLDLPIGKRFGQLTVVELIKIRERRLWKCLCDCGGPITLDRNRLINGFTKSCGCLGGGLNPNALAIIYYVRIKNPNELPPYLYKIGVTNELDLKRRFNKDRIEIMEIERWYFQNGREAFLKEQEMLKEYQQDLYNGPNVLDRGNTELFGRDVLGLDKKKAA